MHKGKLAVHEHMGKKLPKSKSWTFGKVQGENGLQIKTLQQFWSNKQNDIYNYQMFNSFCNSIHHKPNFLSISLMFTVINVVFPKGDISGCLQTKSRFTISSCSLKSNFVPDLIARLFARLFDMIST